MRNLIYFLQRYYLFFLFLFFQSISFYMLVNHNNFQQAAMVNSSNILVGNFYKTVSGLTDYLKLKETNELLQKENAMFRSGMYNSFYDKSAVKIVKVDSNLQQQFTYMAANVINNSTNKRNNYLTLNRGSIHGVKKKMGVICPNGVVGIVMNVSEHYCSVLSLLNNNSKISAKIKETNDFGPLVWDGDNPEYASLVDINKHAFIKVGQTVVTSSFSTIFPEDIPLGKIIKVEYDEGGNFYKLKIKLSTNFSNITSVYIINNLMKDEVEQLKEKSENEPENPQAN
ncbi:MAG: rod shape-determining protein MreC [Bacteroidetes bacterium]|nr:rod shape-determining protein MreC [Bacteroidota bacterium]